MHLTEFRIARNPPRLRWVFYLGSPCYTQGKNLYYAFFLVCCGCDTSYIVSVHIQCQASIFTLSLCRGLSWRHPSRRRWLLPGTWSHLWFAVIPECLPWCSILGATVTVHQFFCILHVWLLGTLYGFFGLIAWGTGMSISIISGTEVANGVPEGHLMHA